MFTLTFYVRFTFYGLIDVYNLVFGYIFAGSMAGISLVTVMVLSTLGLMGAVPADRDSALCKYLKPNLSAKPQTYPAPFSIEIDRAQYTSGETLHCKYQ